MDSAERRGGCLSALTCMEITLKYLSDPGYQISVAQMMGVTQSSVSKIIKQTLHSISSHSSEVIKFPTTLDEIQTAKQNWRLKHGFPFCLGSIDCTHMKICKRSGQLEVNL